MRVGARQSRFRVFEVAEGVVGIDHGFEGQPHLIASYVLLGPGGRFALIEAGPERTYPNLLAGLEQAGLELRGLQAILVTHIHLDHAGACGLLAREVPCPIYVHERGLPHLAEPSRLWARTVRTFGPDAERFWKGVTPVPPELLRPIGDGTRIELFGRRIDVIHAPGHASHHVALLLDGKVLFAGDAAGVRLPGLPYVRPPAVPPELHIEEWEATLQRLRRLRPSRLVLTHYGAYAGDLDWHLDSLLQRLHRWAEAVLAGMREGLDEPALARRLSEVEQSELRTLGVGPELWPILELTTPAYVAVRGLQRYWQKVHPERVTSLGTTNLPVTSPPGDETRGGGSPGDEAAGDDSPADAPRR